MLFVQPSHRRLLNSLNPIFFVLVVLVFIVLRTTLHPIAGFVKYWDLLLPFAIYFGQRRTLTEGLILSLFTSHLISLSSSAPVGVFTAYYLAIFLCARLLSLVFFAHIWYSILLLLFALSLLSRVMLTVVASSFGHGWPMFSFANWSFWGLMLNTLAGYLVYRGLEQLDRLTHKTPPARIELTEGEL